MCCFWFICYSWVLSAVESSTARVQWSRTCAEVQVGVQRWKWSDRISVWTWSTDVRQPWQLSWLVPVQLWRARPTRRAGNVSNTTQRHRFFTGVHSMNIGIYLFTRMVNWHMTIAVNFSFTIKSQALLVVQKSSLICRWCYWCLMNICIGIGSRTKMIATGLRQWL